MLLRFRAGNQFSLWGQQELSLVASVLKDDDSGLIDCPEAGERLVTAAIIYGANASGKSNLVRALNFMRWQVLYSHSRQEPDAKIGRSPFALMPKSKASASTAEIDFVIDGVRYNYGFEVSDIAFDAEWLISYPSSRRTSLFSRKGQTFTFGRSLKGQNSVIAELTRPNSLFVAAAAQSNHEDLLKIRRYFENLRIDQSIAVESSEVSRKLRDNELDQRVIDFLQKIGAGIVGYRKKEYEYPKDVRSFRDGLADLLKRTGDGDIAAKFRQETKSVELQLAHQAEGGKPVYFDLNSESAGTRRLLALLRPIFLTLDEGGVIVVDELDASLHTLACEAVISLFCSRKTNPKGAQLIATTHDTNLLRSSFIRRDQIWFTEKDEHGATHLYPLTDIATRQGDNLEKGYLQGRFGAIPFAGSVADMFAAE